MIAACGARSTTPPRPDPIAIVDAGVEPVPVDAQPPVNIVVPSKPGTRIESPHGAMITDLAVTPDGTAAVTADDLGGQRLWPALDGSLEPRVIELPAPSQLAIGHDPKGFLISLIDEAGGLVVQQVDRDGLLIKRATLPLEPIYKGLAMTDRGPLAWRADQRIVRVNADGAITSQLATEPGLRLVSLAVPRVKQAERAVAILEGATDTVHWRRARWVSVGDKLAWGEWIAIGDDLGSTAAVSPSLKRLAVVSGVQAAARTHVFDLSTAKALGAEQTFSATHLELPDDDHLVFAQPNGQTHWLDIGAKRTRPIPITQPSSTALASGGGRAFNPNGNEIAISDASATRYLGYGLQAVQVATSAEHGQLAIAHGDRSVLLNDKLLATPMPLVPVGHNVTLLRWLGGQEFAVQSIRLGTSVTTLSFVDLEKQTHGEWRTNQVASQLNYEPSTKLLAVSYGQQPEVARYVPGKLRVDPVARFPKPAPYDRVHLWPVSPQLAGGTQVVTVVARDTTTVRWVPDARSLDKGTAMTLDGSVAAVDATGRVYAWQNAAGKLDLATFRDGKRIGKLELAPGGRGVWPDATGERVIVSGAELVMFGPDGARVWARPFAGVTHAVWLDDGAIAIVTALGIARLDAKTGEIKVKRCGWAFELASAPHQARPRIEPMCTQR